MNRNDWELTVGSMLILAAGVVLFAPLVTAFAYPDVVLAVVTLVAAVGVVLVGLSRRDGRYGSPSDTVQRLCRRSQVTVR
jgi:hypothetical protein